MRRGGWAGGGSSLIVVNKLKTISQTGLWVVRMRLLVRMYDFGAGCCLCVCCCLLLMTQHQVHCWWWQHFSPTFFAPPCDVWACSLTGIRSPPHQCHQQQQGAEAAQLTACIHKTFFCWLGLVLLLLLPKKTKAKARAPCMLHVDHAADNVECTS